MFERVTRICGQHYANIILTSGSATYQIFKYYYYGLGYQSRNRTLTINRNLNINRNRNPEIDPNPIPKRKNNRNVCSTNNTGIKLNIRVISKSYFRWAGGGYTKGLPQKANVDVTLRQSNRGLCGRHLSQRV